MTYRVAGSVALACVASSLILSACGSSGSHSTTGSGSSTSGATAAASGSKAATGSPIRILTINTLNQPAANQPEGVAAAQAAVRAINASGGIKGHPIEMDVCNNNFSPNGAVACARQAATGPYVAVVGGWYLPGDAQAVPIDTAAGIAIVGMTPVAQVDATATNWFPLDGGVYTGYPAVGTIVKNYVPSAKRVALVTTNLASSANAARLVAKGLTFAGLQNAGTVIVPFTATDYSSYAAKLQQDKPDAVALVMSGDTGVPMLKAMGQIGMNVPFVAPSQTFVPSAVAAAGPIASKGLFFASWLPQGDTSNPGVTQFLAELKAGQQAGIAHASPAQVTGASFESWLAVHLFAEVASGINGDITRASVLAAMQKARNVSLYGLEPAYNAPPGPDPALPSIASDQVYTLKLADGSMQLMTQDEQPIHILRDGFRG